MPNHQEEWGGEVRLPRWLRSLLHRPDAPDDTPEAAHEKRKPPANQASVLEQANKAAGAHLMTDFYNERRPKH